MSENEFTVILCVFNQCIKVAKLKWDHSSTDHYSRDTCYRMSDQELRAKKAQTGLKDSSTAALMSPAFGSEVRYHT